MGEDAKRQDGGDKNAVDFTFKVDQTKCFISICFSKVAVKYEDAYKEYIVLKLRIDLLISFIQHVEVFSMFSNVDFRPY